MRTIHTANLLFLLAVAGCSKSPKPTMPAPFQPPGIQRLPDIDRAKVTYNDDSVIIQGVVSPSGQGGWPGKNDGYKVHSFSFAAWRKAGGKLIDSELTILRPVPPDADYFNDFAQHSIQRIRVMLSRDETRAIFLEAISMDSPDSELESIAAELKKPVVVSTERFGDLVLDRRVNWFEAETEWNGKPIRVSFPSADSVPDENAMAAAEALWINQASWQTRIEQYAVKELLELKNDTWLEEGELPVTVTQFVEAMTLTAISLSSDGTFEFWYDDGDLFWGHSIMVRGNAKDGPDEAGIYG